MTVLYEQGWGSGDYFAFSSPKKKNKVGRRRREQPSSFPPLVSTEGPGPRRVGRGRGTKRTNSSQQVQDSARPPGPFPSFPFPSFQSPPPSSPSPPLQAQPCRGGRSCTPRPAGPKAAAGAMALGLGVGRGFPAGESSPGAGSGGGEGMEIGEWRIKEDSSSARARPARGILGKKWPRGTGRARRGAGVRGQGPGAPRAEPPT